MTPVDAVNLVMEAGGVAGFAHPAKTGRDRLINDLMKYGLGSIEVYHSDHGPEYTMHYQAIARRYGLIPTGGSDSHGYDINGVSTIGNVTVDMEVVERLREAAPAADKP
jgi:predicted metal-dependent phosphoesterase TrpH